MQTDFYEAERPDPEGFARHSLRVCTRRERFGRPLLMTPDADKDGDDELDIVEFVAAVCKTLADRLMW